jgi:hypothetical protein
MNTSHQQIKDFLMGGTMTAANNCAAGTGLTSVGSRVFPGRKLKGKEDVVKALSEYYADGSNIAGIFNSLDDFDKELVTRAVQFDGGSHIPTFDKLAAKYGIEYKPEHPWRSQKDSLNLYFLHLIKQANPETKATLLFPGGRRIAPFVLSALKKLVPPLSYEYQTFSPGKGERVICRENRLSDIEAIVRFCAGTRVKVNAGNLDVSKSSLAKAREAIGFDEICDDGLGGFCDIEEAKKSIDTRVAQPLFALLLNSGLIEVGAKDGCAGASRQTLEMLAKPPHELAKQIFDDYMRQNGICESHYLTGVIVRDGEAYIKWNEARAAVVDILKTCPIGEFIDYADFEKYMSIFRRDFIWRLTDSIEVRYFDGEHNRNEYAYWENCYVHFIRVILTFLSAIGVADIAYTEKSQYLNDWGGNYSNPEDRSFCVGVSGVRLTRLGAWIIGAAESYEAMPERKKEAKGGMVVNDDFTVAINSLRERIRHETYLSRFLSKVSDDENAAVYKIDFAGIVRAYDQGVTPDELEDYLNWEADRAMPKNVADVFAQWRGKAGKIRIRTVTLLETDDRALLGELRGIKTISNNTSEVVENAVVINDANKKRIKAAAEKNGWLVKLE